MGRIPEEELERIKRSVDLVGLVRGRGVELVRQGKDWVGRCPFHSPDEHPSLVVTAEKGLWHCFGCDAGGSVLDWVMRTEGVSLRHAYEILNAGGPPPAWGAAPVGTSTTLKLAPAVDLGTSDQALVHQVLAYYQATLQTSPEALAYLKRRGIGDPEAVRTFRIGYANRTLGLRLPAKTRDDGVRIRHRLTELGILRSTGHEHYSGAITFPVLDEQGQVAEIYGRKIRDDLRDGTAYHLYRKANARPDERRGVWNLDGVRVGGEVILCEALIDALTFWCAGFQNVTSSYGTNGFTAGHLGVLKASGVERVLIAYDRDEAGDQAAEALARRLAQESITSFRVLFPRGMDANEYALKVTPAAPSLALLLRSAVYLAGPLVAREAGAAVAPPASSPTVVIDAFPESFSSSAAVSGAAASGAAVSRGATEPPDPAAHALAAPSPAAPPVPSVAPVAGAAAAVTPRAAEPAPVASPVPAAPRPEIPAEVSATEVVIRLGDRRWRIRGLARATTFEQLRVNVLVARDGQGAAGSQGSQAGPFHVDTLDLYAAKQRAAYIREAATELGIKDDVVKQDLGQVLLKLEALQEQQIKAALEPKTKTVTITEPDRQAALELLRDPRLLDRILADFERCGVVGEETNKLVGYLAAVSRKLDRPLAVLIQSSSAAGKSALMSTCLAFVPEEERVAYSAMTGQSLFYMGEADLAHKILAIAEEEGAERAAYALKLLQSEGELSIASTGKDPSSGRLVTHEYRVQGPVGIFLTTTAIDLDEELLNRCLVLSVDEDREQTRAIHRMQREAETLEGYYAELDRAAVLTLHRNAQRLLAPIRVVNPYARELTFLDDKTRTRRDHLKYLGLIRAIALLHQHQRPITSARHHGQLRPHLEVSLDDIEAANRLAHEVLGRTLDELPPQSRRFLVLLEQMVRERCAAQQVERRDYRFTRAEVRRSTGWSLTQVKLHLDRLVELEYVLVHRGSRGQSFVYELLYAGEGSNGKAFLLGLLDVEKLRKRSRGQKYGPSLSDLVEGVTGSGGEVTESGGQVTGSKRGQNAPETGGCRGREIEGEARSHRASPQPTEGTAQNARHGTAGPEPRRSHGAAGRTEAAALPAGPAGSEGGRSQ